MQSYPGSHLSAQGISPVSRKDAQVLTQPLDFLTAYFSHKNFDGDKVRVFVYDMREVGIVHVAGQTIESVI